MSADGKIYITISDTRTGEVLGGGNTTIPSTKKPKENIANDFFKHQFFNFIENEAKQMANYSLSNIGNFTGDYNAQRQVNFARSAINVATGLVTSAYMGFAVGGPIGTLIGDGISAASQVINFGLQLNSESIEIKKQNYNIQQLRQLSGLDGLTNGSRI